MNISYEQIRAFVAVAETGSFSAAARRLNKHRTTLGQVISNLEIETNMTLFERSGKFPELTDNGRSLFRHAKNLYDSSVAFETLCQTMESGIESDVTVYHTDLMPVGMIEVSMRELRLTYPNVNVHWLHRSADEVKEALRDGSADLGIVLVDSKSQGSSPRNYIHLMSMPFCVVAAPTFLGADIDPETISISDLKTRRQLILEDYYYAEIERTMMVSSNVQRIENINIFNVLLNSGEGWAIAPVHAVSEAVKLGKLIELNIEQLNTRVRYPLAIWSMDQKQTGPVRRHLIQSLCHHAVQYEELL
ncbi:LysR family transcriptional regulator [uncultured Vibrio sp.]|uniref:LysR family transcriptional regulator n=1 Tax=uncultured Vibrio sp. TaxID=114054 RepID=UPI0025EA6755|nr:LysR family transcriptional regulator [uncultured Vibrio sp.]